MTIDKAVSRRGILTAGAGVAGVVVLAACSGGSSGGSASDSAGDGSGADVITPPTTEASTSAAGSSAASAAPSTKADDAAGPSLASLDDIDVGGSRSVKLADGKPAIVTRTGTATAVCFSAICTHQGCTVKPKGGQFDCPCHGSTYNAKTGAVLGGPAPSPLPKIPVTVADGKVTES